MKFKSATLSIRETTEVVIRADLTIKVGSLPMGIEREYQSVWPKPSPPFTEINKVGQAPTKNYDYDDAVFVKAYTDWEYHRNVYYVWRCIHGVDISIEFEFSGETEIGIRGIANEIKLAGFSDMDLASILKTCQRISIVSQEDIDKAKASFLLSLTK